MLTLLALCSGLGVAGVLVELGHVASVVALCRNEGLHAEGRVLEADARRGGEVELLGRKEEDIRSRLAVFELGIVGGNDRVEEIETVVILQVRDNVVSARAKRGLDGAAFGEFMHGKLKGERSRAREQRGWRREQMRQHVRRSYLQPEDATAMGMLSALYLRAMSITHLIPGLRAKLP